MLNELIYNIVRNGAVFSVEEKYLKKGIDPYNLFEFFFELRLYSPMRVFLIY